MNNCDQISEQCGKIQEKLEGYEYFSLEDLAPDNQMNRYDLKYVFKSSLIPEIIEKASTNYRILNTADTCLHPYQSIYFDTDKLDMYNDHHNGKANRYKIRIREYLSTGNLYLEVKRKTNKGFTIKKRIRIDEPGIQNPEARSMIKNLTPYDPSKLKKSAITKFYRCTFLHKKTPERVTLDYCIQLTARARKKLLPGTGIIEIKKKDVHLLTDFEKIINNMSIIPCNFSKYCMSLALLHGNLKYNRFKENILFINQLENEHYRHSTNKYSVE